MAEVKLLPCPFCGADGLLEHLGGPESTHKIARCSKCKCDLHFYPTPEAAAVAWNTRTLDARLSELKDTLVEAAREACLVLMDEGYGGANPTLQRLDAALSAAALFEQEKAALEKRQ